MEVVINLYKQVKYYCFMAMAFFCFSLPSASQFINKEALLKFRSWPRYAAIDSFYKLNNHQFVWVNNIKLEQQILQILRMADVLGLNEADYQFSFLKGFNPTLAPRNFNDSLEIDVRLTDAALHFFSELQAGNKSPDFGYKGLPYQPNTDDAVEKLRVYLLRQNLAGLVDEMQPRSKEYLAVRNKLNALQRVINDSFFTEAKILSNKVDASNRALLIRLFQLGVTDSVEIHISTRDLIQKVRLAQKQFDVLNDGVLRSTTLQAFNCSLYERIEELKTALNYIRWLEQLKRDFALIVNIPSADFKVYDKDSIILDSKIIVGKKLTPTPTLTSTIKEVVLYPYWVVPQKIATKELLPSIKKNISFLEAGNFQVISKDGKVLDPYTINWRALSASYFPYTIRQSTGCDNALGIVKFNFYNPFTVYLHDTPAKPLFFLNKRYFSHGCMRVEKPVELAHILLGRDSVAIDTLIAKGCINLQAPIPVAVERPMPIVVLYSTAWYDREGVIKFYDDVYNKL